MTVLFPAGVTKFTSDQIEYNITSDGYITSEKAGTYYFSIQGQNRIGKNYPYILGSITLNEGSNLEIKVKNLKWAEEWIYIVIGVNVSDDLNTFTQILKIPGKLAGIYGTVLSENYKSAIPPRDFWNYDNYMFVAPYAQGLDGWAEIEYKIAGKNIDTTNENLGLGDTWSVTGNILLDKQLTTFTVINDESELPSVAPSWFAQFTGGFQLNPLGISLNGHLVQLLSTGLIYEFNVYDSGTVIDHQYTLATDDPEGNGRWKAVDDWGINVVDIFGPHGSHQNLNGSGDLNSDNRLIVPNYFVNAEDNTTTTPPIVLWLANYSNTTIKKYNKIRTEIRIADQPATELFSGKVAVTILGYVNLTNYSVRIRNSAGVLFETINKRFMIHQWQNPLQLPDDLAPGEAIILRYELIFEPEEFRGILGLDAYIKILPGLTRSVGTFLPFGAMFGPGLILQDGNGYNRRIVPGVGLSATALPGAGIVQGFAFPYQEAQTVANLPANTANVAIYINSEGFCFGRDYNSPPPQSIGYGLRATVSTSLGWGDIDKFRGIELNYSAAFFVTTGTQGLRVKVYHRTLEEEKLAENIAQIRGDLPDVVAGYPCQFNCSTMDVLVRRDVFSGDINNEANYTQSIYYEFTNIPITSNVIYQTLDLLDPSTASASWVSTNTFLPNKYGKFFGIYIPPQGTLIDTLIEGSFPPGRYWVAVRYYYNGNCISRIDHDPSTNHIREFEGGLDKLLEDRANDRYWDEPVATPEHLSEYPVQRLWEGKILLCKAINGLYRFTYYLEDEIPDGHFIIKHNSLASGAWLLVGERGAALQPADAILPFGGNLLFAPWGKGIRFFSGRYLINQLESPTLSEVSLSETQLRNLGFNANWYSFLNQYWVIRDFNQAIAFEEEKAGVLFYNKGIVIGKVSPNKTGQNLFYFHHESIELALNPFTNLVLNLDYSKFSSFISPIYKEKRLRMVNANLNADYLVIVLEEVIPRYVFIDNLIRWQLLTNFVSNKEEYYVWLTLNTPVHLTTLATALNISENTFTTNKQSTELSSINTTIRNALTTQEKTDYPISVNDYWEDYIALINYCLIEYNLFESIIEDSPLNFNALYKFVYTKNISYVGGESIPIETLVLNNKPDNPDFGGAYYIGTSFDNSKLIRDDKGFCPYLFEPPAPVEACQVSTIPESEWGTSYTKLPQDWEYGDVTPSNIIPNTYKIHIGFGYKSNSSQIVEISLNSFLDDSFPRISGVKNSDWVKDISTLANLFNFDPTTGNQVFHLGTETQGITFMLTDDSANIAIKHSGNTIEIKAAGAGSNIYFNNTPILG